MTSAPFVFHPPSNTRPSFRQRRGRILWTRLWVGLWVGFILALLGADPARAAPRPDIVRDAETESFLRTLATPVLEQAGLSPSAVHFVLVLNRDVNAFVAGGLNIFIYTGLLQEARTPEELLGVIAHEVGHITGGHLIRSREARRQASATAILATLAGVAAAAGTHDGAAGAAAVSLGQQVAQRTFLQYSRTQESAADQAALRFLAQARISAQGMHDFLERLQDQDLLPADQQSAFVRTHPLSRDRVEAIQAAFARGGNGVGAEVSSSLSSSLPSLERIKAKLAGFVDPRLTLQRPPYPVDSFTGRYARAIALHQTGDTRAALDEVGVLIKQEPRTPYLQELRAQILYESGRVEDARSPYRLAVELSEGDPLLRIGLAQALLDPPTSAANLSEAITQLEQARDAEQTSPLLWRLLATAYGRQNNLGMAAYALSEEALASGDNAVALQQAKRAQSLLPSGSSGWIRAGDVIAETQTR